MGWFQGIVTQSIAWMNTKDISARFQCEWKYNCSQDWNKKEIQGIDWMKYLLEILMRAKRASFRFLNFHFWFIKNSIRLFKISRFAHFMKNGKVIFKLSGKVRWNSLLGKRTQIWNYVCSGIPSLVQNHYFLNSCFVWNRIKLLKEALVFNLELPLTYYW